MGEAMSSDEFELELASAVYGETVEVGNVTFHVVNNNEASPVAPSNCPELPPLEHSSYLLQLAEVIEITTAKDN